MDTKRLNGAKKKKKKKEWRREEEVFFLFSNVKERRAPRPWTSTALNSDRQARVVGKCKKKKKRGLCDDEQDQLSSLFMTAETFTSLLPRLSWVSVLPSINSRLITSFSACTVKYLRDASNRVSIASSSSSGRAGEQRQEAERGTRGIPFV